LTRVADSELGEQDDRSEERQERGAEVTEERRPIQGDAHAPRRLFG
jgi:hypothetical protein